MKFEFSAGGIVVKKGSEILHGAQDDIQILLCQHSQHHGWVFPKGLIGNVDSGFKIQDSRRETKEEAALREVLEETGVVGKILEPLTPITYLYNWEGEKRKKTVYYFIMEYVSGDITNHDFEMENVEWLPIDKVEEKLTYDSDKEVWKEAIKQLAISH